MSDLSPKEQLVVRQLRKYYNEIKELEEELDDPVEIIQLESALIQLDEKYAKLIAGVLYE